MPPRPRPFTIADAMILVAAGAAGLLIAKEYAASVAETMPAAEPIRTLIFLQGVPGAILAPIMLALIPLNLKRPRPALHRLARRPGFAACCVGTVALAWGFFGYFVLIRSDFSKNWVDAYTFKMRWASSESLVEPAVVGAWLLLIVSRRWRPEPTWTDRLGRLIGAWWIASLVFLVGSDWILPWLPAL